MKYEGEKIQSQSAETENLAALELKANLNTEQRNYLEKLKAKRDKILQGKTIEQLAKAGDIKTLEKYNAVLDEILEFLRNKIIKTVEIEKNFNLLEQYNDQVSALKDAGILQEFKNGKWGIIDIVGTECPIPSYEEIFERIEAKAELLEKKREQGFTQLLIVPFGMELKRLIGSAESFALHKWEEDKFAGTDGQKMEINPNQIFNMGRDYRNADIEGNLVYGVNKFDRQNHGGKTKKQILARQLGNPGFESIGWQIKLVEDLPDLPGESETKVIGGRRQIGANQSPARYLELIENDPQYEGEQFTTPEDQLTYFIQYLQKNNKVIDDVNGQGKSCWNAGAFLKIGEVPFGHWRRNSGQFEMDWIAPHDRYDDRVVRSTVVI